MKFVDEAVIDVAAGNGGRGALSFHRARNVPKGGPDGGNGGVGGDVFLVGDAALNTLVDFRYTPQYRAANGAPGSGSAKTGANGEPLRIRVPVGTSIIDDDTRGVIGDIAEQDETLIVARGGKRGFGNVHFKSSTNRAPRYATPGQAGERRRLRLTLRVIADVGLLGMPNAGKSTLISRVSASKPKIADYPFTTLVPNLGTVRSGTDSSFVMADVPGLIPGASAGAGLGFRFLKHLSRTRLLLHLVDGMPADGSDAIANARAIENELFAYSDAFRKRDIWMVATKMDLPDAQTTFQRLQGAFPARRCYAISALTGSGLRDLVGALAGYVDEYQERVAADAKFAERERDFARRIGGDVFAKVVHAQRSESDGEGHDQEAFEVRDRRG